MSSELAGGLLDPSNVPASDHSKKFLDGLFGSGWNLPGSMGSVSDVQTLIFDLFGAFNGVAMFAAAAILCLSLYKGLVGTAQEGQFLGKQMSSVWAPLRSALAIAMLTPVFKGLCAIQLLVLLCIGGSVNLANSMWDRALDFLQKHDGQYYVSPPAPTALDDSTKKLARGVLKSLAIRYHQELFEGEKMPADVIRVVTNTHTFDDMKRSEYQVFFTAPVPAWKTGLSDRDIGRITIDHKYGTMHQVRLDAVAQMVRDLMPLAQAIVVKMHPGYVDQPIIKTQLEDAINRYNDTILANIETAFNASNPDYREKLDDFIGEARAGGWFMAGVYYWNVANFSNMMSEMIQSEPQYSDGDEKLLAELSTSELPAVLNGVNIVSEQIEEKMAVARSSAVGGSGVTKKINDWLYNNFGKIGVGALIVGLMQGDVIINMANMGHDLLTAVWAGAIGAVVAQLVPGGSFDGLANLMMILLMPVAAIGIFLAFYLPAIPFISWIMGLASWVILLFETMFAAPLWAVAHALPEGEGFSGQYGRTGYMMLFGVLVRPPLMVAGLMCAMVAIPLFAKFLGASFLIFHASMSGANMYGVLATFAFVFLGGSLFVVVTQKFFGLITWLPEHVTKWVGQQAETLGEAQDEAKNRAMFVGAAMGVGGAANSAANGIKNAVKNKNNDNGGGNGQQNGPRPQSKMSDFF